MSKYDEFDLDIQKVSSKDNVEPKSPTAGTVCQISINWCETVNTALSCHGTECACVTFTGCSADTCSACRSYCGSGC